MLKILAILALLYFFFRSVGHVVRLIFGGGATTRTQNPNTGQQRRRTTRDGLHVDSMPNQQKKKKDFKGGDYVDYEEVE
jgi:uncharacterized protein DUF4834